MPVVKVIELLGESGESWEDATRQVVAEATKTLHGGTSIYVKEFQATVDLLADKRLRIGCTGGRLSQVLAIYLGAHLQI